MTPVERQLLHDLTVWLQDCFVSLLMWNIFVCRDSWDQRMWMLSWHTKQTTAVRRSELMLDWWSKAVVAAAKWVHVQWIQSTPRSVVGPQSCLGRCPKTKCLKVSLAVSSLNNIANVEAVPKGTYLLWSQNALAPVSSHTSTLCQHSLWGLLVVWVRPIWYWYGLTQKSASLMNEVNSISPKLNFQGNVLLPAGSELNSSLSFVHCVTVTISRSW